MSRTENSLRGRVAIVTGGSSGIGRAVSLLFAESGAKVSLVSNVPEELAEVSEMIRSKGGDCTSLDIDLSQPPEVARVFPETERALGSVDILVNNAGIGLHKTLVESNDAEFRRLFEVNFFAVVSLAREALTVMSGRGGNIVNVSSASARRGLARMTAYGATKGAMHIFTQALRIEAAPQGVLVSEILPISVSTPFFEQAHYKPSGWVQTPELVAGRVLEAVLKGTPEICTSFLTSCGLALDGIAPNVIARLVEWWERRSSD